MYQEDVTRKVLLCARKVLLDIKKVLLGVRKVLLGVRKLKLLNEEGWRLLDNEVLP